MSWFHCVVFCVQGDSDELVPLCDVCVHDDMVPLCYVCVQDDSDGWFHCVVFVCRMTWFHCVMFVSRMTVMSWFHCVLFVCRMTVMSCTARCASCTSVLCTTRRSICWGGSTCRPLQVSTQHLQAITGKHSTPAGHHR